MGGEVERKSNSRARPNVARMPPAKDPCGDRVVKDCPPMPACPLSRELLYDQSAGPVNSGKPGGGLRINIPVLRDHLVHEGRLNREDALELIERVSALFRTEPNLLRLKDPITVVGDIHGQYYDLCKLIDVGGDPETSDCRYLFLGDYVDRGSYSVEVLFLVLAYKLNYPDRVWMLRGNHECRQMTAFFNFRDECELKYDNAVYNGFMEVFDSLPLAATINGKFLTVHGGLSPDFSLMKQLDKLDRFVEPPKEGILCDLLWSDPAEEKNDPASAAEASSGKPRPGAPTKMTKARKGDTSEMYVKNEVRGCSWFFTYDAAVTFLRQNELMSIVRAHEAQVEGYKMHRTNEATSFPTVITLFSAPNYCDVYNNKGAVLRFENNTLNILQFNSSPHPYHLPGLMDLFSWSMPFVVEKVTEMLYYIMRQSENEQDVHDEDEAALPPLVASLARKSLSLEQNEAVALAASLAERMNRTGVPVVPAEGAAVGAATTKISQERADRLRSKVRSVGRLAKIFKTLRKENEMVLQLKGLCPGHKLEPGLLLKGKEALQSELERFDAAHALDMQNEKRPE